MAHVVTIRASASAKPLACAVVLGFCGQALGSGNSGFYFGDLGQALVVMVIFVVLLVVLGKWAWKPIVAQLRRREEQIAETLTQTKQDHTQAQELLDEYRQKLSTAQGQADAMLNQSRKDAARTADDTLQSAREQARQIALDAQREIGQARKGAIRELQQTTAQLAGDIAAKVISEHLNSADHDRLVDLSMKEIGKRVSREQ